MKQPKVENTEELEKNQEELFKQCYFAGRVTKTPHTWEVTFGARGGKATTFTFTDEAEAKGAYAALENAYLVALDKMQEAFVEAYDLNN